eukprot:955927-Rhodomonas_salina.1
MGVLWDSVPADASFKDKRAAYGKNSRRVASALAAEQDENEREQEVNSVIRLALENQALQRGFDSDVVTSASLAMQALRQMIAAVPEADPGVQLPLDEVDLCSLGRRPLGASFDVAGRVPVTPEQKQTVLQYREAHKN